MRYLYNELDKRRKKISIYSIRFIYDQKNNKKSLRDCFIETSGDISDVINDIKDIDFSANK